MSVDHYAWAWELRTIEARVGVGTVCLPLSAKVMLWGLGVTKPLASDNPLQAF